MAVEDYRSAAPLYRAAGWQGVIPLPPGRKYPPPQGFTGEDGSWPSSSDVQAWQEELADGNVGLRLPDGVIGVDADTYKKAGAESWATLIAECGPLPPTWRSTSRDDGSGVLLYRVPCGTKLAGSAAKGVEVVQHSHRYLCVWPSIHPEGGRYRWIAPDGSEATLPDDPGELAELPESWLERLTNPPSSNGSKPRPSAREQRSQDGPGWAPQVGDAFAEALEVMGDVGSRHDAATSAAMALARYEVLGDPGATEALESLGVTFTASISADRATPEEAGSEWRRILSSARHKAKTTDSTARPRWSRSGRPRRTDQGDGSPPAGGVLDSPTGARPCSSSRPLSPEVG